MYPVTPEQERFIQELWGEEANAVDRARAEAQSFEPVVNRGVDAVYREIGRAADRLVAKGAKLTRDEAITRVLYQRPELYDAYQAEFFRRQRIEETTERGMWVRLNKEAADEKAERERVVQVWNRTADEQAALERQRREARRLARVTKAATDAYEPIRRAAVELRRSDPDLGDAEACALAVERYPDLYADYRTKLLQASGSDG